MHKQAQQYNKMQAQTDTCHVFRTSLIILSYLHNNIDTYFIFQI